MKQRRRQISQTQLIIEQVALLFTSFIWTFVILSIVVFVWAMQDIENNWNVILGIETPAPPEPDALSFAVQPLPTSTPWPGPPPSATPTETLIPTETPTTVLQPPSILPDTPNESDPTPIPIIIHTEDEAQEFANATAVPLPANTATPTATATPLPPPPASTEGTASAVQPSPTPLPPTATPTQVVSLNQPGPPTRMEIKSVGIDSEVIPVGWNLVEQNGQQYSIWQVADYAVGWHKTTAFLGQPGNTVLAGHHNINGEVFKELVNVEVGDEIIIYSNNIPRVYHVELKTIVKEKGEPLEVRQKNAQWIAPTTDERITMVTCWPYTNNTHRVIVVAKPG